MNARAFGIIANVLRGTRRPRVALCLWSSLAAACAAPTAPTAVSTIPELLSPRDGAVLDNGCASRADGITWEFDWSDVPHAARYHLLVQHLGSSLPVIDTFTASSSYQHAATGAYIIESNRFDWQWKVEAEVDNAFRGYSPAAAFSVEPLSADCQ